MKVHVKYYGVLRRYAKKSEEVLEFNNNDKVTVLDIIKIIKERNKELYERIFNENKGKLVSDIVISINNIDIRLIKGLDSEVKDGDVVSFISVVHGG